MAAAAAGAGAGTWAAQEKQFPPALLSFFIYNPRFGPREGEVARKAVPRPPAEGLRGREESGTRGLAWQTPGMVARVLGSTWSGQGPRLLRPGRARWPGSGWEGCHGNPE